MKKLESRLQFLIGLSLFFPIIMQAVFDKETSGANNIILKWGLTITVLIASYLYIEYVDPAFSERMEKVLNGIIGVNILMFIPVILILAFNPVNVAGLFRMGLTVGFWGIMMLPVILLSSMLLYLAATVKFPHRKK